MSGHNTLCNEFRGIWSDDASALMSMSMPHRCWNALYIYRAPLLLFGRVRRERPTNPIQRVYGGSSRPMRFTPGGPGGLCTSESFGSNKFQVFPKVTQSISEVFFVNLLVSENRSSMG